MTVYRYAGFWRRLIAYMIDGVIISVILMVFMVIGGIGYVAGIASGDSAQWLAVMADPQRMSSVAIWIWLFSFLFNLAYFTFFHGATGRTPGKTLLALQVVSADGQPISYGVAFLRSVGYFVSSLVFFLGYIWIGFDRRKQGWHDKIAGTVVIIREPQGDAAGLHISDGPQARVTGQGDPHAPTGVAGAASSQDQANSEHPGASGEKMP